MFPFDSPHPGEATGCAPLPGPDDVPGQVRVRGTGQLVALVPYQLGFLPTRSLVAVALHRGPDPGPPHLLSSGGIARIDLPDAAADVPRVSAALLSCLRPVDPSDVLLVAYGERATTATAEPPAVPGPLALPEHVEDLVDDLTTALGGVGIAVLDVVVVDGARWASVSCLRDRCCPPSGSPLPVPAEVPAVAELVGRGAAPLASRSELAASATAGSDPQAAVVAALIPRARASAERRPVRDATVLRRWRAAVLDPAAARADDPRQTPPAPAPAAVARLVVDLERDARPGSRRPAHSLRDALLTWCDPPGGALDLLPREVATTAHQVLGPCLARPLGERTALVERLAAVVRCVPAADCAELSAVLGLLAWRAGDVVRARAAAEQALVAHPGHGLATLVVGALDHGVPPWQA